MRPVCHARRYPLMMRKESEQETEDVGGSRERQYGGCVWGLGESGEKDIRGFPWIAYPHVRDGFRS